MKRTLKLTLLSLAAFVLASGTSHASTIAGWDFSQYVGDGFLITEAAGTNTLAANYSALDPTFGAGAESAAYGTMFINGTFGSTFVDPDAALPAFVPAAGSLVSNLTAPAPGAQFDSLTLLQSENQTYANELAMTARSPIDVVFNATTAGSGKHGENWGITFGGKTFSGASAVGVSFSLDGSGYSTPTIVNLDATDKQFGVTFGAISASTIYVRLSLPTANGQPIVDNVSLNATLVPEPGSLLAIGVALAGLAFARRSR